MATGPGIDCCECLVVLSALSVLKRRQEREVISNVVSKYNGTATKRVRVR